MDFAFSIFLSSGLLALTSDFLDASFLVTVSLTMYAPFCGFRENETFFSVDRFLLLTGCSLALILRTMLLFCGVDHLAWDGYCEVASAFMFMVFFVEVLVKWRRAVYGRSQIATSLGRRLPEERGAGRAAATASALEDGRRPLALDNVAQESHSDTAVPSAAGAPTSKSYTCREVSVKISHFLVPGLLVLFASASDGQTMACEQLAHDRADLAIGQSVGLVLSTLLAVLLGGFLKWYLHDVHLLLYMSLIFFAQMVLSVQGSVVAMVRQDLPTAPRASEL